MVDPFEISVLQRSKNRKRITLRTCEPDGTWFDKFICAVWMHKLAPSPDEATFVYSIEGDLMGMVCLRCGGLIDAR